MLITKIYLAAMSRADKQEAELNKLPNFYLYVDEFQSFANKSFADILSEARKYKLNLTIAHQYIEQMEEEVRDAVFGNVGSMVAFRVGALDAELLEKEFAPTFTAEDMVNLGFVQIYLKLMIDGISSSPFSATTLPPIPKPEITYRNDIIESSRSQFSHPKKDVETEINRWHEEEFKEERFVNKERPVRFEKERRDKIPERRDIERRDDDKQKKVIFEAIIGEEEKKSPSKISLENLKPIGKNDKNPTPKHVSQLREALAALVSKGPTSAVERKESAKVSSQANQSPIREEKKREETPKVQSNNESLKKQKPNEIPEDDLRKLLHVDTSE